MNAGEVFELVDHIEEFTRRNHCSLPDNLAAILSQALVELTKLELQLTIQELGDNERVPLSTTKEK